ncbi:MAG: MerR family transcriptional regulator [Oryzihumus sp.]
MNRLPPSRPDTFERTAGGRRYYGSHDVAWLNLCLVLRGSGMPLPAIRRYTELARQGDGTEAERLALLREHEQSVLAQLRMLNPSLDLIRRKVAI